MAQMKTYNLPARAGPEGIGGWLILPTIGLCLTLIQGLIQNWQFAGLGANMGFLTGGQRIFILLEMLGNIVVAVALPIYLLYLLFNKKRMFPRRYVTWVVLDLTFVMVDLLAAQLLFRETFEAAGLRLIDGEITQPIFRAFVLVAIWAPYMLNSRRVLNTFVN